MLLKSVHRAVNFVSPQLAAVMRDVYFTINGWRFQDLKDHFEATIGKDNANALSLQHSVKEILEGDLDPERIAFVTNLPPDDTGIATCSYFSWLGHKGPVDLFCPVVDADWFFANGLRLRSASKGQMRVLDVNAFLTADEVNRYRAVVLSIGNSNHIIYIHNVLKKAASVGDLKRFVAYLHDPCILNFVQRGGMLAPIEMIRGFEVIYDKKIPTAATDLTSNDAVRALLVDLRLFGTRFLLNSGVTRFIVNSESALEIVKADLSSEAARVTQLFHPAFLPVGAEEALALAKSRVLAGRSSQLTIGTFGVPAASKLTHRVVGAAQQIRKTGVPVRLMMAGYGVRDYLRQTADDYHGLDVRTFDGPTDLQLLKCMAESDVAVQLRSQDLGESSGIVPQLLCLGKSTIVSDIGSFREFGRAVKLIPNDIEDDALVQAILDLWEFPISERYMRDYVSNRTPERFREELLQALATT